MSDVTLPEEMLDQWIYLSSTGKALLVTLYRFKDENGEANRSRAILVECSGLSASEVSAGLRELQQFGWIVRTKGGRTDNYKFRVPYVKTD